MCRLFHPCGKILHPLTLSKLAECLWRPNSGCEHSKAVEWCIIAVAKVMLKTSHVLVSYRAFYEHSTQALFHHQQKCIANGGDGVEKQ